MLSYLPAAVALAVLFGAGVFAQGQSRQLAHQSERAQVLATLGRMSADLETTVHDQIQTLNRLAGALAVEPDMIEARFRAVARSFANATRPAYLLAAIPREGQPLIAARDAAARIPPGAIPLDAPLDRPGVARVGGQTTPSLVLWLPVQSAVAGLEPWGRVVAVLGTGDLLVQSAISDDALEIALIGYDAFTPRVRPRLFAGNSAVMQNDPVAVDVPHAEGSLRIAAVPVGGWNPRSDMDWPIRLLTLAAVGLIVGPMVHTRRLTEERQCNIDKLRDREVELERLSRRLGLALAASKVGVWDYHFETDELVWDARMDELYFMPPDGRARTYLDWRGRLHPDDLARAEVEFRDAIERTGHYMSDYRLVLPDGSLRHIRAIGAVFRERGRVSKIVGVNWDVTADVQRNDELEAKRIEAEAALIAKSQFLATMSHEIRTPMNGVLGMLDLLLRSDLDAAQRTRAEVARDSAGHLLKILNDILDFSKLEINRQRLQPTDTDVQRLVREVVTLMSAVAEDRGIAMTATLGAGVPPWIVCDPTRLRQVLMNLVGNAVKFTDAGSIDVRLDFEPGHGGGEGILSFAVRDTGVGISEQARQTLFQRFVQVDASFTRARGGTGLGLAISKQIVELMGGEIALDSVPGLGSTFHFWIPARIAGPAPVEGAGPLQGEAPCLGGMPASVLPARVLVVEDNPTNQQVLTAYLSIAGHTVRMTENGREALDALRADAYDVVIMDIQMPVMDGLTAARHIRELPHPAGSVPIIALTANAMMCEREAYLAAGMNDYVCKPVVVETLFAAIARATAGYSSTGDQSPPGSKLSMASATSSVSSPRSAS